MRIGLLDIDGIIPNIALMKISTYFKKQNVDVSFVQNNYKYNKIYASTLFTKSKPKCKTLLDFFNDTIEIGGTGWDINKTLPSAIDKEPPDFNLYTIKDILPRIKGIMSKESKIKKATQIINAGMGFTSRGCIRNCGFCVVPKKEGNFKHVAEIKDLLNPRSNVLILCDNNITADPNCIDKLHEIRDRGLYLDINQGIDIRILTDDIAKALSEIKHLRSIHYAWDLMIFEKSILEGIRILSKYIKPYKHMCFMLVGFNTSFDEDYYRFKKLSELNIKPYVMIYNQNENHDQKLKHFARWVNGSFYHACSWNEYLPWIREKSKYGISLF